MPRRTPEEEKALWTDRKRITNADISGYAEKQNICEMGLAIVPTGYNPDKERYSAYCR